jgi:hypothetical protein
MMGTIAKKAKPSRAGKVAVLLGGIVLIIPLMLISSILLGVSYQPISSGGHWLEIEKPQSPLYIPVEVGRYGKAGVGMLCAFRVLFSPSQRNCIHTDRRVFMYMINASPRYSSSNHILQCHVCTCPIDIDIFARID